MSERDFFKRFWLSVASGIVVLVLSGIVASSYVARATTDRSIRNEQAVKELTKAKADKGWDDGIHQTLLDATVKNEHRIEKQDEKANAQFQFIIQRLDIVNQNILNIKK